jgi:glycosyltransferase involved in cell wall biosynthesis
VISFVWTPGQPLPAGTGGSENYTVGHVRELNRRGIAAQVVTIGLGAADGRDEFTGVPFMSLVAPRDVSGLDGTVVFVTEFPETSTRNPAYQILHIPPPLRADARRRVIAQTRDRALIATSRFAAELWSRFLDVDIDTVAVVYPFAEPGFGLVSRPVRNPAAIRILYAGRLSPEKGIYTLLAMLHSDLICHDSRLIFTATTAGADKPQGRIIQRLEAAHPRIDLVPARKNPAAMAALMAEHDIVVMPSNSQYWHETFGIVSIEAQHAGCHVVASDDGGLPETDCGATTLVTPDNADALARGILQAIASGPPSDAVRRAAATRFTVAQSVDQLLAVLTRPRSIPPAAVIRELEQLVRLPAREGRPVRTDPVHSTSASIQAIRQHRQERHDRQIAPAEALSEIQTVAEAEARSQEE